MRIISILGHMKLYIIGICIALCIFLLAKQSHWLASKSHTVTEKFTIERIEKKIYNAKSIQDIQDILDQYPLFTKIFLGTQDKKKLQALYEIVQDTNLHSLYLETVRIFQDLSEIEIQLTSALKRIKIFYPTFHIPQIATFITGMGTDLFIDDSLIVIGLDFFLGSHAKFQPPLPKYILRRLQPTTIVPNIIAKLAKNFIQKDPKDDTFLSDIIYYGKICFFVQEIMPNLPDSVIIGYTDSELKCVQKNQHIIWQHFIENELLYSTDHIVKKKYIRESPFILQIDQKCPGRIGRWIGWKIIQKYNNLQNVDLVTVMQYTNAQALFQKSKYRPKK